MKKIFIVIITFIIVVVILALGYVNVKILNKNEDEKKAEDIVKDITFEPYSNEETLKVLVTVEDTENYIDSIEYVDKDGKDIVINCQGNKSKVAFDYEIVDDGEYTFTAHNKAEEIIEKTLIVDSNYRNIIDIKITPKSDTELITEADVSIDYNNNTIEMNGKYKIGKSDTWSDYTGTISINSYQILENSFQEDDGKTVTIYAKKEDNASNKVIISKSTMKFDLDMPNKPIINIEDVSEYANFSAYGYELDSEIEIQYDDRDDIINYYSVDNGNTWKEYVGKINTKNLIVWAKSVKRNSGLTIETFKRVQPKAADALGSEAYDGDESTGAAKGKIYIDSEIIGKNVRIYFGSSTGTWGSSGFSIYDADGNSLLSESISYRTSPYDKIITIPENASYLVYSSNSGYSGYPGLLYEIQIQNQAQFEIEEVLPVIKDTGIEESYNKINIIYYQTAEKKLYKIDNGEWNEYNDDIIDLRLGETLYAKSIDKYGKETIEANYLSKVNLSLSPEAYDNDYSTYSNDGRINIDSSLIGKNIRIRFSSSSVTWSSAVLGIYDSSGNELFSESRNYTNPMYDKIIVIPENAAYLSLTGNYREGLLYELELQD